jgi:P27 family predicted phage terminase small subunit|nr:MAG TPA: terminase small subunit [Caudoviricetes sp.]DAJ57237.1 MAG TPA: terminase small subunit [Caudoviricetes sp.]
MTSGRKNTPTQLKVLNGNPGKRPLNQNEPKPKPVMPECPSWLNGYAKKMWKDLGLELHKLGLLTNIDGQAFAAACQSYGIWVECEHVLKEKGRVMTINTERGEYNQQRPEVSIGNSALKNFRSFCSEFGLSPAARASITVADPDSENDFSSLLSG